MLAWPSRNIYFQLIEIVVAIDRWIIRINSLSCCFAALQRIEKNKNKNYFQIFNEATILIRSVVIRSTQYTSSLMLETHWFLFHLKIAIIIKILVFHSMAEAHLPIYQWTLMNQRWLCRRAQYLLCAKHRMSACLHLSRLQNATRRSVNTKPKGRRKKHNEKKKNKSTIYERIEQREKNTFSLGFATFSQRFFRLLIL